METPLQPLNDKLGFRHPECHFRRLLEDIFQIPLFFVDR
jgi:hypothetical protein